MRARPSRVTDGNRMAHHPFKTANPGASSYSGGGLGGKHRCRTSGRCDAFCVLGSDAIETLCSRRIRSEPPCRWSSSARTSASTWPQANCRSRNQNVFAREMASPLLPRDLQRISVWLTLGRMMRIYGPAEGFTQPLLYAWRMWVNINAIRCRR
jgi:hypothetical protein